MIWFDQKPQIFIYYSSKFIFKFSPFINLHKYNKFILNYTIKPTDNLSETLTCLLIKLSMFKFSLLLIAFCLEL